MEESNNLDNQNYAWFIDDTAIALYESFEKAKKELQDSPEMIKIIHGDKEGEVPKEQIYIAPL